MRFSVPFIALVVFGGYSSTWLLTAVAAPIDTIDSRSTQDHTLSSRSESDMVQLARRAPPIKFTKADGDLALKLLKAAKPTGKKAAEAGKKKARDLDTSSSLEERIELDLEGSLEARRIPNYSVTDIAVASINAAAQSQGNFATFIAILAQAGWNLVRDQQGVDWWVQQDAGASFTHTAVQQEVNRLNAQNH
ncbi:hypothetical protein C8J56DRAFT_880408 [Mycena floridula]|nr:hypothetical protein C8J56DRAFT_880408 [Mycena floridula]